MNANSDDKNNQAYALKAGERQRGFSLIEIMVALTLSLFLITGMIQLLIGNKQSYRVHEAQSRMQENGRFSLEVLNRDVRMAGFTGCRKKAVDNVLNNPTTWWENFENPLIGYEGTEVFPGKAVGTASAGRVSGTDAIMIIGSSGQNYSIVSHAQPVFTLNSLGDPAIKKGKIITICDNSADSKRPVSIFQVKSVGTGTPPTSPFTIDHGTGTVTPSNSTATLNQEPPSSQTVMMDFTPVAFYIGVSSSGTSRSLYRMQLEVTDPGGVASMVAQELVEGVQDMQITYGEDTTANNVINPPYRDATDVTNWNNVLSVRINLLMTSLEDNLSTARQTVIFPADTGNANTGGNVYTPASTTDRRLRQVFSSTIGVRNRLP